MIAVSPLFFLNRAKALGPLILIMSNDNNHTLKFPLALSLNAITSLSSRMGLYERGMLLDPTKKVDNDTFYAFGFFMSF